MRGDDRQPETMFSYVAMETRIPQDCIRNLAAQAG